MLPESHSLYDAELFLKVLFEKAPEDQFIEFRCVWDPGRKNTSPPKGTKKILVEVVPVKMFEQSFDNHIADWIVRNNRLKYDIYFGICPRRKMDRGAGGYARSGKNEDVSHATCAWMDYDKSTWKMVLAQEPKPTMVVFTGNGAHFYYLYQEAVDISRATADAELIRQKFGGDNTCDPARIFRVPGTKNWKHPDNDSWADLKHIDLDQKPFEGVKAEDVAQSSTKKKPKSVFELPWDLRNTITAGHESAAGHYDARDAETGENDRSKVDFKVMLDLFQFGYSEDEIRAIFLNPEYGIGAKVREEAKSGNAENYLGRTADNAKLEFQKRSLQHDEIGDVLVLETWEDLAKAPPLQFAIDRLLPIGGMLTISGPAKTGKSLLVNDLALLLAGGEGRFAEQFKVNKTGNVVYCQAEVSKGSLEYRMHVISKARGIENRRELPIFFLNQSFDLGNPRHVQTVVNGLKKVQADYLIIDPLARFHHANENRQHDMANVLANIDRIKRDAGCLGAIMVHHHGKPVADGEREGVHRIRGASVIGDWGNAHMLLRKCFNKTSGKKYIEVEYELRDAEEPPPIELILDRETLRFSRYSEEDDNIPVVKEEITKLGYGDDAKRAIARRLGTTQVEAQRLMAITKFQKNIKEGANGGSVEGTPPAGDVGDDDEDDD